MLLNLQSTPIQASISLNDFKNFSNQLIEGKICEFGRFTTERSKAAFSVVAHEFCLIFNKTSIINQLSGDFADIPTFYCDIKKFEDIGTSSVLVSSLIGS